MPVALATVGVFAVVTQKNNSGRTEILCERHCASTGITAFEKINKICARNTLIGRDSPTVKNVRNIIAILVPPHTIHCIEHVRPWAELKGRVGDYYPSPRSRLAPRFDFFTVACGKAWPTGNADGSSPGACKGRPTGSSAYSIKPAVT